MGNLTDLTTSWEGYTKGDVEDLIKSQFSQNKIDISTKFSASIFDQDKMTQYFFATEDDMKSYKDNGDESLILYSVPFNFSGTVNQIKVINEMPSANLFFTTQSTEAIITLSFISQQKGITDSSWQDVNEDFEVSVLVDRGGVGSYQTIIDKKYVLNGDKFSFDIRSSLMTGSNRVRIIVNGLATGSTSSFTYTVTLTTMYLAPSNFSWHIPFVEGESYSLGGMNIGGNLQKVLRIRVAREEVYIKEYEVNLGDSIYTSTAYTFNGLEFPTAGSGVYNVELWLDANGLLSEKLSYNIICVKASEKNTAQLVSVSSFPDTILNFSENKIFEYCIYNKGLSVGSPVVSLDTIVNTNKTNLKTETLVDVPTSKPINYSASLELEVVESKMQLSASITLGNTQQVIYPIDNSKSYPATSESILYINPSQRSNAQANKHKIVNAINQVEYDAEWTRFGWTNNDGWTTDDEGRMCLNVPAYSRVNIAHQPMSDLRTPITMEFVYKVKNASDYDDPIITIWNIDQLKDQSKDYNISFKAGFIDKTTIRSSTSYSYSYPIYIKAGESINFIAGGWGYSPIAETNEQGSSYTSIKNIASGDDNTMVKVNYVAEKDMWISICSRNDVLNSDPPYIQRIVDLDSYKNFTGVKITPKNICLQSRNLVNSSLQDYNTNDESVMDVIITIVPNYKTNYGNLAQIYCNGVKVRSFEFTSIGEWNVNGNIVLGSDTADLFLYKMRVYHKGFDKTDAMRNFINSLPDITSREALYNKLLSSTDDSYNIDYDSCVKNGYNTMVIEMLGGKNIPSLLNQESGLLCNLQINIHNIIEDELDEEMEGLLTGTLIEGQTIEGQGTTAMTYGRWNFRWKLDKKYGKRRITAKKNVASSMQSHKMGATRMFNYLHRQCVGANEANANVTVLQYPVFGFQKVLQDDGKTYVYRPIGLYTVGADKGDKHTFGFDNDNFSDTLIQMEGSDHTPKSVGFDYPWDQTRYSAEKDVESIGAIVGDGIVGAWEVGAAGDLETDSMSDESSIQTMLNTEFKPAYNVAYNNSPFIICVNESLSEINSNIEAWRKNTSPSGESYSSYEFFNKDTYNIMYYNENSKLYEETGVNLLSDLGISRNDLEALSLKETEDYIINLRKQRFIDTWGNYWHKDDTIYHYVFMLIFGATDNFKKNTYPYKFKPLNDGGKWRWRADDLDTIFDINNQGLAAKSYSILVGDKTDTGSGSIYRGDNSALWTLIKETQQSEIKSMVHKVFNAMVSHPNAEGSTTLDKLVGCVKHFFWDFAQNYFPESAYNSDTEWTYEDIWANKDAWKEVNPLSQALGGHKEAEKDWVSMRVIFLASYYNYGPFVASGYKDASTGQMVYGGAEAHTYEFIPAIDFNPTIIRGSTETITYGGRGSANSVIPVTVSSSSGADTRIYVQGLDWIKDVGDLSTLTVSADNPTLNIASQRLQRLKIGDLDPSVIPSSGTIRSLTLGSCPSLTYIDSRNLSTLDGTIDLSRLYRLREAYFGGTNIKGVKLQEGSKIEKIQLPGSITELKLKDLKLLKYIQDTSFDLVKNNYISTNKSIGTQIPLTYVSDRDFWHLIVDCKLYDKFTITGTGGNSARLWCFIDKDNCLISVSNSNLTANNLVLDIPENASKLIINFNATKTYSFCGEKKSLDLESLSNVSDLNIENCPNIDGFTLMRSAYNNPNSNLSSIRVIGFTLETDSSDLTMLSNMVKDIDFNGNYHSYTGVNAEGGVTDHPVIEGVLNLATPIYRADEEILKNAYGEAFVINANKGYYMPFEDKEIKKICANNYGDGLGTTEEQVKAVNSLKTYFRSNTNIKTFDELKYFTNFTQINSSGQGDVEAFSKCSNLELISFPPNFTMIGDGNAAYGSGHTAFSECTSLKTVNMPESLYYIGNCAFYKCSALEELDLTNVTYIGSNAFSGCTLLKNLVNTDNVETLGPSAFSNCPSLEIVGFNNLKNESLSSNMFYGCSSLRRIDSLGQSTKIISNGLNGAYGDYGFAYDCSSLEYANLNCVTSIGDFAFKNCSSLEEVVLGDVTRIGSGAFFGCSSLSKINLNDEIITYLGTDCFRNCTSLFIDDLNLINLESFQSDCLNGLNVRKISSLGKTTTLPSARSDSAYYGSKTVLEEITIPDMVTEIPDYSFYNYKSLRICNGLENVTKIGLNAFAHSSFEGELYLPNLEEIGNYAFVNSKINKISNLGKITKTPASNNGSKSAFGLELTEVVLPETVQTISSYSFTNCNKLTNINIPESITKIESWAFGNCTSLEIDDLYLPNLEVIETAAFYDVKVKKISNLGKITSLPSSSNTSRNLGSRTTLEEVVLPDTLTSISDYSFYLYSSLTRATIPTSITSIGILAFNDSPISTKLDLPNITDIGSRSFDGSDIQEILSLGSITELKDGGWVSSSYRGTFSRNSNLTKVVLPETLTKIGYGSFAYCNSLSELNIPETITSIGEGAFYECESLVIDDLRLPNLETLSIQPFYNVKIHKISDLGKLTSLPKTNTNTQNFGDYQTLKEIILPNTLLSIPDTCFEKYLNLEKVYIPESVTIIGKFAFNNLSNLEIEDLYLPNLKTLGYNSFVNTKIKRISSLGEITEFTNSSTWGGTLNSTLGPFAKCSMLESVVLPESIQTISDASFDMCLSLVDLVLSKSIRTIGKGSFVGVPAQIEIDLPNLTSLNQGAFRSSGVTRVLDLGSITTLVGTNDYNNYGVFEKCNNLEVVILPDTITEVGNYSMRNCNKLKSVILKATVPPTIGSSAFTGTPIANGEGYIYVPDDSVEAYSNATNWNTYSSFIAPISEFPAEQPDLYNEIRSYLQGYVSKILVISPLNKRTKHEQLQLISYYGGEQISPVYSIDNTSIASISQDGTLSFSEEGSVVVTIEYNGMTRSKEYTYLQADIVDGVTLEINGSTTTSASMSTVGFVDTDGATSIQWGVTGGTLGRMCEYTSDGTCVDYWGASGNPRTVAINPSSTLVKASFETAYLDYAYIKDTETGRYLWKGKLV